MNSCVLIAKIVRAPQLRYTTDNELAVTDMMVEFQDSAPNSSPHTLKVVAWGNLATQVNQQYTEGNEVILTGRLKMNLIERQEGFKEKIAELIISQIYPVGASKITNNVVHLNSYKSEYETNSSDNLEPDLENDYPHNNDVNGNDIDHIPF
jgi:single-stranded DNA-binding protein